MLWAGLRVALVKISGICNLNNCVVSVVCTSYKCGHVTRSTTWRSAGLKLLVFRLFNFRRCRIVIHVFEDGLFMA
jgi:hypothetical protein